MLRADRVLLGRDTRESGARIEHELAGGLVLEGAEPLHLGVLPTPAIAFTAAREGAPAAIISASHNPWTDNGVKVIGADGAKLPDDVEAAIEAELQSLLDAKVPPARAPVREVALDATGPYVDHLLSALEGRTLAGLDVVIDCANGAASPIAASVFERAGRARHDVARRTRRPEHQRRLRVDASAVAAARGTRTRRAHRTRARR